MKTKLFAAALAVSSLFSSAAFAHERPAAGPWYSSGNSGHQRGGRYELQNVQRWVPGRYVDVPCHGGSTVQWQPGYYTTVQEWVWVEGFDRPHRFGRHGFGVAWR